VIVRQSSWAEARATVAAFGVTLVKSAGTCNGQASCEGVGNAGFPCEVFGPIGSAVTPPYLDLPIPA
jgi:hypothetical protein